MNYVSPQIAVDLRSLRNGLADSMFAASKRWGTPRVHIAESAVGMTDRMLARHYCDTGRILFCPGERAESVWGPLEVNTAFRTWHDWCHLKSGLCGRECGPLGCFEPWAEYWIADFQCRGLPDGLARIVQEEVYGQNAYYAREGALVQRQIPFALEFLGGDGRTIPGGKFH